MTKKIYRNILWVVIGLISAVFLFLLILFLSQYRPEDFEVVSDEQLTYTSPSIGDEIEVITWNIGYAALGEEADFFMDGGKMVDTATKEEVYENLDAIEDFIISENPDIIMLQEVDIDSKRSHNVDEVAYLQNHLNGYINSFATNFKVLFLPYPIPPIGQVNCGISTFQRYDLIEADRIQLYCPFNYIVRAFNLRRCLLVNRIPIEDSDKELVIVNLHLEAYDSGIGKIEQAKELRELIQSEYNKGNYVIAGGDFNQVFSSVNEETKHMQNEALWQPSLLNVDEFTGFRAVTDTVIPTCRSLQKVYKDADTDNFPAYTIDGFLVSENLEIIDVNVKDLNFRNSDHNPVALKVKIK